MQLKIGFSKSKRKFPIGCWLIMLCERTKFSHTYVKFPVTKWDMDLVYHAVGSGVNFVGPCAFNSLHEIVEEFVINVPDSHRDQVLKWCAQNCGAPYSHLQILGLFLKRVARLIGIKIKNPLEDDSAYICTELAVKVMSISGETPDQDLQDMGLVETYDFVKRCSKKLA